MIDTELFIEGVSPSRRRLQCLEWAARGKTVEEVARLLSISRPTAKYHLDRAKTKLGAKTTLQAAIALRENKDG